MFLYTPLGPTFKLNGLDPKVVLKPWRVMLSLTLGITLKVLRKRQLIFLPSEAIYDMELKKTEFPFYSEWRDPFENSPTHPPAQNPSRIFPGRFVYTLVGL